MFHFCLKLKNNKTMETTKETFAIDKFIQRLRDAQGGIITSNDILRALLKG
jgi:hypothetical protein